MATQPEAGKTLKLKAGIAWANDDLRAFNHQQPRYHEERRDAQLVGTGEGDGQFQQETAGRHVVWLSWQLFSLHKCFLVLETRANISPESQDSFLLEPCFVGNEHFTIMTQSLAGIDRSALCEDVGDLSHFRSEIITAIDFVLSGI